MRLTTLAICAGLSAFAGAAEAQDAKHGAQVFSTFCGICHSVQAGRNVLGPSLHGVVGRKAGTLPGFNYSPAFTSANVVWSETTLDTYLADPKAFIPKNRMGFNGVKNPKDRADLIAYLAAQK
jgi:cytochrome c2